VAEPRPEALPPESRPVGQVVAETLRLYGRRFWPSLALGLGPTAFTLGAAALDGALAVAFVLLVGPPLLSAVLALATRLAADVDRARLPLAVIAGIPALLPLSVSRVVVFPGIYLLALAWYAFFALAVPAVLIERRGAADSIRRAVRLARADYVHALGSVATLAILVVICIFLLFVLLANVGEQALEAAALLAVFVVSPVFFLGTALLYFDQAARLESPSRKPRRKRKES
jgi:hypothetical protein